jgi:translocation and assembly module TamB
MSWQRSKHIAKHSLKWLNWTLVLPTLVLTACLLFLLYTAPGLRLNIWLAETLVSGLSIQHSQGSLLGGHQLSEIRYQQDGINVRLQRSELQFNSRCLLSLEACIKTLILDELQLDITTINSANANDTVATPLWLPFPLTISQISINNVKLNVDGQHVQWQHFSAGVQIWGNKVQLLQPQLQQVNITLADTAATPTAATPFSYTPPVVTDFSLPLSLFIDNFRLTALQLQQNGTVQQLETMAFSLQWQQQQLTLTELELVHAKARLQAAVKLNTSGNYPLDARLQLHLTDAGLGGQQLTVTADGNLADLQLNAQSSAPLQAELSTAVDLLSAALPHELKLKSPHLQWPLHDAAALKISQSQLQLRGDINQSHFTGQFRIEAPELPAASTSFSGYASLSGITLEQLLLATLDGQILATGSADWQQQLHWQGLLQLENIQPGLYWPDYSGNIAGTVRHSGALANDNSWQLNFSELALNGTLRDYQLALTGAAQLADLSGNGDYQLSTEQLKLQHAGNSILLFGKVQQAWQLELQVAAPALGRSLAGVAGNVQGQFAITGPRNQPELSGILQGRALRWQDLHLGELQLDADVWLDSAQQLNSQLKLNASDGRYQQQDLQHATLTLQGSEQQHQLSVALLSSEHQLELELHGAVDAKREKWQGQLQQAALSSLFGRWQTTTATAVEYLMPKQQLQIAPHCWQQQSSELCLKSSLVVSPKQATVELTLNQFNLATIATLLPSQMALTGIANAGLSANWQQGKLPVATLNVNSAEGSFSHQLDTPLQLQWQQLSFTNKLQDDNLNSTLQLKLAQHAQLNANIKVSAIQQGNKQLSGQLQLQQLTLKLFQPLLGEFSELQGQMSSELQFSGNLNTPELHGEMRVEQLRIKGKTAPVDIDNADILLSFTGRQATINGLLSTPQGEVNLSGDASWQQLTDWQAKLHLKGDELRLQVPNARLQIAPDLTLRASPELLQLHGNVNIPAATINIDSLPDEAVELSDDLVLLNARLQPVPQDNKSVFNLQTDINVLLGNQVKLSAFGLKTKLNGKLRVRQQPRQALRLNGDVRLQDGTFRAYGQDLLIRKGKMSFNGPADQPFLNIEAIRNPDNMEDDVIAGIRVSGPADEPNVVIFSEPAKAQANALSYLLMGRDLDSSSGGGSNAVTTGLIGMTLASSSKVVGELGEAFGLQDLTLDTAGAGDNSQVTVSGYLSRDLQLKYGYGIFNAVGEFTLRYRLMRRLYLEAVSGVDNAVDLLYKFEFD